MDDPAPFARLGPAVPAGPVVVSVPHAGRHYPAAMARLVRPPLARLATLEDRHVDRVAIAAAELAGSAAPPMLVATAARAWIDLNRGEEERDRMIDPAARGDLAPSAKVRSGLGIVPRRAPGVGDFWRGPLAAADVDMRIATIHRPFHEALASLLAATRARFGVAVLLDLHSMPPLGRARPQLVFGDRFGDSAAGRFVHRLQSVAENARVPSALNAPYAGGHVLVRHGAPGSGIHAVQVELDRSLYLDARMDQPGPGLMPTAALVAAIIDALADEALDVQMLAAE